MKLRSFFKNLVGSVAVLVTAYAKPWQRVDVSFSAIRFLTKEEENWRTFNDADWIKFMAPGVWPSGLGCVQREVKS